MICRCAKLCGGCYDTGDCFVDVGANIGVMTSLAIRRVSPRGRVIALEPNPELFPILQRNASNSPGAADLMELTLLPYAAGDQRGCIWFELPDPRARNTGLGRVVSENDASSERGRHLVQVESFAIDSLVCHKRIIRLVKIDVEGREYKVLRGMERLMRSGAVQAVLVKEHRIPPTEVTGFLSSCGFRQYAVAQSFEGLVLRSIEEGSAERHPSVANPPSVVAVLDSSLLNSLLRKGWNV